MSTSSALANCSTSHAPSARCTAAAFAPPSTAHVGDRGQRAAVELHAHAARPWSQRLVGPAGRSSSVSPTIAGAVASARAAEAQAVDRAPDRYRSRPRIGKDRSRVRIGGSSDVSVGRSSTSACAGPTGERQRRRPLPRRRQRHIEHVGIDRSRLDRARCSVSMISPISSRRRRPPTVSADHVAGRERKPARRQRELGALASGPEILQPDVGAPFGGGIVRHHREIGVRSRSRRRRPAGASSPRRCDNPHARR